FLRPALWEKDAAPRGISPAGDAGADALHGSIRIATRPANSRPKWDGHSRRLARRKGMNPKQPQPNEDEDFDPKELEAAAAETLTNAPPPELDEQTKHLTQWDEAPASSGTRAPKVAPEDEIPLVEQLIHRGIDEAERDRRMAAADPDFEP